MVYNTWCRALFKSFPHRQGHPVPTLNSEKNGIDAEWRTPSQKTTHTHLSKKLAPCDQFKTFRPQELQFNYEENGSCTEHTPGTATNHPILLQANSSTASVLLSMYYRWNLRNNIETSRSSQRPPRRTPQPNLDRNRLLSTFKIDIRWRRPASKMSKESPACYTIFPWNFLRFAHKCTQGTGFKPLRFPPNSITTTPATADTKPWWIRHGCGAGATTA